VDHAVVVCNFYFTLLSLSLYSAIYSVHVVTWLRFKVITCTSVSVYISHKCKKKLTSLLIVRTM